MSHLTISSIISPPDQQLAPAVQSHQPNAESKINKALSILQALPTAQDPVKLKALEESLQAAHTIKTEVKGLIKEAKAAQSGESSWKKCAKSCLNIAKVVVGSAGAISTIALPLLARCMGDREGKVADFVRNATVDKIVGYSGTAAILIHVAEELIGDDVVAGPAVEPKQ
jgi:hypothetical protein